MEPKPEHYISIQSNINVSSVEILDNSNTTKILLDLQINEMPDLFWIWSEHLFGKPTI